MSSRCFLIIFCKNASHKSTNVTDACALAGPPTPVYSIVVQCSGLPFYRADDDVSGWVVTRALAEFHSFHNSLKDVSR